MLSFFVKKLCKCAIVKDSGNLTEMKNRERYYMLSFFKNLLGKGSSTTEWKEQLKEESILPATEVPLAEERQAETVEAQPETRDTPLSLHESWEQELDVNQKYSLTFLANDLPPIAVGNVSITGVHIAPHDEGVEVTAFLRNGLPRPIRFEKMNLLILFGDQELFSRQEFDLSVIGEIPPFSARPWTFVFARENFLQKDVLLTNWKIAFELAQKKVVLPQQLELEESWIKALNDEQKTSLIQLAKTLPPLQEGEVNVQSVQVSRAEDGSLRALLLIRNGSTQSLSIDKIPLVLIDAMNEKTAEGLFEIGGLTVNPGTSKPWLFIFPKESIVKENPDLSRWKVTVPQA